MTIKLTFENVYKSIVPEGSSTLTFALAEMRKALENNLVGAYFFFLMGTAALYRVCSTGLR